MAYNLVYNNTGTRSLPLSPEVARAYEQAALAAGIDEIRVVSGGQPSSGPNRTGSHRHDLGGAGDIQLVKGGRVLDFTNPDDLPIISNWVSNAKGAGLTGFGAGTSYMGTRTIHAGGGNPAVWGAEGKGANAPGWLTTAYGSAPSGASGGISLASNPITSTPALDASPAPTSAQPAAPEAGGLEMIASGLSPKPQAQPAPMQSAMAQPEVAQPSDAAAQLLATLMERSRGRYGLSLSGMA